MGLTHLSVKDFVIVDALELEFERGMTVFSGETGAGKSIMIDALGLVLGERAQGSIVRKGADKTTISAIFDLHDQEDAKKLLAEQDIDIEDGECILRRQINQDGRSRAFINGVTVPLQTLKQLSEFLVDIHGQHAHQSLLKKEIQRDMLDEFAAHETLTDAVISAAEKLKKIDHDLAELSGDPSQHEAQKDLLRYQIGELEDTVVSENDLNETLERHTRLANITKIAEACQRAEQLFDDSGADISAHLQHAEQDLISISQYEPQATSIAQCLNEASVLLDEAQSQLHHLTGNLDFDQKEFDQIESRLGKLHDLARKHQTKIEQLPTSLLQLQEQLEKLENSETRLKALLADQKNALTAYQKVADKLSQSRKKAAKKLSDKITAEMQLLSMKGGRFEAQVSQIADHSPSKHGQDRIEFLVAANPGQDLHPLNKAASGGELSRISLAIQVVTSQGKGVPTLVFDEVDVGIGGGTAEIVGQKMRQLGENRQVLCVTHLAQVASLGHHHMQVSKDSKKDETRTQIKQLDENGRIEEIARMLGGLKITDQTLAHAKEMLSLNG